MKVTVHLTGLDDVLKPRIESFLRDNWPHVAIYSAGEDPHTKQGRNHEATITVANSRTVTPHTQTTLSETILVNDQSVEALLYLLNAKLGRVTNSDIAFPDRAPSAESRLSRREFLFGMFGRSSTSANIPCDAPIVSADSCEARFSCRKCIDACPAPGALEIRENSLVVSKERCIRCGVCAGICPVAAIQMPEMSENAYRGLLAAIQNSPSPRKTLVITCDEEKVPKTPWIDVEHVPGIGVVGVRQLAMAASTLINATIVYCADGLCVGKERVKRAVDLIATVTKASPPSVYYLEGADDAAEIEHIHNSAEKREGAAELTATPWKNYVTSIENISTEESQATGLGITEIQIAESCTLCNACADKCPHSALGIEGGELLFDSRDCTGCGYCSQICPEQAITILEKRGPIEFAEKSVYKDEMVRCSKCNTPYASVKMVRKVSEALQLKEMMPICPTCREMEMYEALLSKVSSKVVN